MARKRKPLKEGEPPKSYFPETLKRSLKEFDKKFKKIKRLDGGDMVAGLKAGPEMIVCVGCGHSISSKYDNCPCCGCEN